MKRVQSLLIISLCVFSIVYEAITVHGQTGVSYCACQPSVYTFTFNFSAFCDIATIEGPGVLDADCFERGIGLGSENTNDTVPIQITSVSVAELSKTLAVLEQTSYIEDFRDGDSFTYTAILSSPENITGLTPDTVPGGLQLDLVGINQLEQPITNVWIILFDTVCGIFPILEIGDQIGWTILSDLQEPLQAVCPLAPPPVTFSPTSPPTAMPYTSSEPSLSPSDAPSLAPSILCPPEVSNNPRESTDQPSSRPVKKGTTQKDGKQSKDMNRRMTSDNSFALLSNQYLLHQRQNAHHFYYNNPNLDATGRGVGTRSPVAAPVECPDSEIRLTEKKPMNLDTPRGSKSNDLKDGIISKVHPWKHQKKDPNAGPVRSSKGDLRKSKEKSPEDDLSFIVLTKSPAPPQQLSALVHALGRAKDQALDNNP